jgi:tetratricopeptide (TPR) repeat protein
MNGCCSQCGLEDAFVKKCIRTSNYYYNQGLDKAQVRDLSGAIVDLKRALKYNKYNIEARNLLGLCYHEMGEVVSALSEWVVSQHFQEEDNEAVDYIKSIQDNSARLDDVNATIRKYNQTLLYLRQGDFDLALIQLKRVLGMSPNFVNGHLLIALLYIHSDNRDKAKKELRKVLRIDSNNTLALKYYREIAGNPGISRHVETRSESKRSSKKDDASVVVAEDGRKIKRREIEPSNRLSIDQYVESSNNKYTFIGIIVGLLVGIAAMYFLFIPQKTDELANSYDTLKQEYNEDLASKNKEISDLKDSETSLQDSVDQLTEDLAKASGESSSGNVFENIINAARCKMDGDEEEAAKYLVKVNIEDVDSKDAKTMYNQLADEILPSVAKSYYSKGYSALSAGNYDDAVTYLKTAVEYDEDNVDALYYLGRTYQHMMKYDDAKTVYEQVISQFADSRRAQQAEDNIALIG